MEQNAIGRKIRELRKQRGISAKEFALETHLSPAAISKFERGLLRPTEEFIEKSIVALKLSANEALSLREVGAIFNSQFRRWSSSGSDIKRNQDLIAKREKHASRIRSFWSQIVPGLLQADLYMRSLLPEFTKATGKAFELIVEARKKRQALLQKKSRTFSFVLGEACLRSCIKSSHIMCQQMTHLEYIIDTFPNVEVRVLPFSQTLKRIPLHHFVIYDDRTCEIEVSRGQVDVWIEEEVSYYIELMDYLISTSLSPTLSKEFIRDIKATYLVDQASKI